MTQRYAGSIEFESRALSFFMVVALLGGLVFVISLLRAVVRFAQPKAQPSPKHARFMAVVALAIGVIEIAGILWLFGADDPLNAGPQPHDEATAIALVAIYQFVFAVMGIAVVAMAVTFALERPHASRA